MTSFGAGPDVSPPSSYSTTAASDGRARTTSPRRAQMGAALFFIALLVGYSRIYLAQHFFEDVYIGSILGTVCAMLVAWLFAYIRLRQAAPATEPAPALIPEL